MDNFKKLNDKIGEHEVREVELTTNIEAQDKLISALRIAEVRNAMLAAIINSSQDAIISKDLNGIITSWNPSATQIFGYTEDEMIGKSITTLIPADRQEEEPLIMARLKKGERVDHFQTRRQSKYGSLIDVSLSISPVRGVDGAIIGFSKIARNITELVKAQKQSAILSAIVESSDDAIISKNLGGIITSWNISAKRIFGYEAEEIIGKSILILIPEDRQHEEPLILSQLKSGKRVDHFETKRLTKHNTLVDVSLTISPVRDMNGNIIGLSKIARDISEKKLEEQRKNDFIALVSHELKTPLTSVRSYIQMALAKVKSGPDSFTGTLLTRAEFQTMKMVRMINDFLNLNRLDEGRIELHRTQFSLAKMMEEVLVDGRIHAQMHVIEYNGVEDLTLYADREKMIQVMSNLLSNAVKYSPEGSFIQINCKLKNNNLEISFSDQGMGISKEDQPRLFERFYRVKNEQIMNVSGFGIGLYLVAEILRLHSTEIKVESELGKGSTFYFELPIVA